ncbi:MAG: hypothetical protein WCF84_02210 [Anaerolineae bacterium]
MPNDTPAQSADTDVSIALLAQSVRNIESLLTNGFAALNTRFDKADQKCDALELRVRNIEQGSVPELRNTLTEVKSQVATWQFLQAGYTTLGTAIATALAVIFK